MHFEKLKNGEKIITKKERGKKWESSKIEIYESAIGKKEEESCKVDFVTVFGDLETEFMDFWRINHYWWNYNF